MVISEKYSKAPSNGN